jgi:hypothetical protein
MYNIVNFMSCPKYTGSRFLLCHIPEYSNLQNVILNITLKWYVSVRCSSIFYTMHQIIFELILFQNAVKFYLNRAGIAQLVWRRATGWMAGVRFPVGGRDFSLLHSVQTGSGAHPAS